MITVDQVVYKVAFVDKVTLFHLVVYKGHGNVVVLLVVQ